MPLARRPFSIVAASLAVLAVLVVQGSASESPRPVSDDDGASASGAPAGYAGVLAPAPAPPAGLDDALQPIRDEAVPDPARSAEVDLDTAEPGTDLPIPLWERLAALLPIERPNAHIEFEPGADAPAAGLETASSIAALWNAGGYEQAIASLRACEEAGARPAMAIAWAPGSRPQLAGGGADVRIGTRTDGRAPSLDFHAGTGHLFSVIAWGGWRGPGYWSVNLSTNGGATWSETYSYYAGASSGVIDVSAAVVGSWLYVGYSVTSDSTEARMRRFAVTNGLADNTYSYKTVVGGVTMGVEEISVASNAQAFDNRIYMVVLQKDGAIRFFWDVATDGTTFTEESPTTYVPGGWGLDASWGNAYPSPPGYFLLVSYVGTDGNLRLLRHSASAWLDLYLADAAGMLRPSSISAYGGTIIVAYEHQYTQGRGIRYSITYDSGENWNIGDLGTPDGATVSSYTAPDVVARDGKSTAIVFSAESGEPDEAYYRYRLGFAPGVWSERIQFNDYDVTTGAEMAIAHLPLPWTLSHGAIYFFGGMPYFDRPADGTVAVPGQVAAASAGLELAFAGAHPARGGARLALSLAQAGEAMVAVYDLHGARVRELARGPFAAGRHPLSWDGRGADGAAVTAGVYFVQARSPQGEARLRLVILK